MLAAADAWRAALELLPEHVPARLGLGRALHASGRLDEARKVFETVVATEPENAEALAWAGRTALDAGAVAPDDPGSFRSGVIDAFHPAGQELPEDAGRTISAWAWAASRAMDYLERDPDIDPTRRV